MHIIVPKRYTRPTEMRDLPLFFLAGPVRGGGDWQHNMALLLQEITFDKCIIACPCRWDESHPLAQHFVVGSSGRRFDRQLNWERYYINEAAIEFPQGCVVFWLGQQKEDRPIEAGPYGLETQGELGEMRGRMMYEPRTRVIIGGEPTFLGLDTIQRNFAEALHQPTFRIYDDLEATARRALRMARTGR